MEKTTWKTLAIIFFIIAFFETSIFALAFIYIEIEEDLINECFYDICSGYPDADYLDGVCHCYKLSEDETQYELDKSVILK